MLLRNTLLMMAWLAITGEWTLLNGIAGFCFGYIVLWVTWRGKQSSDYFAKVQEVIRCAAHFLWELCSASFRVALEIVSPRPRLRPAIIAIPVDPPDTMTTEQAPTAAEITTLANLITLTPGTLCLDVSPDGKTLYVHTMHADDIDDARRVIQTGLGKRVRRVFRKAVGGE